MLSINQILTKEPFVRMVPADVPSRKVEYEKVSQAEFLREYNPSSHKINSIKYYPNLLFLDQSKRKHEAKIRSRVAVAWQRRIHTKRLVALTGYDPDITSARSKSDEASQANLAKFKEGWALKGMDTTVHLAIRDDLKVGDVAICGYKSEGRFGTRIFSYAKGDTLYPHFDPMTGELDTFGRAFTREIADPRDPLAFETVTFLDVWTKDYYVQYRSAAPWEIEVLKGDGWVVSSPMRPHAFPFCPVAYHRYGEPCWAGSQSLIETHELAMSQLAENNAQYALRILYALGAEFEMEGSTDGTPNQINSTDPNAKVGFLEPADSSGSFEVQLNKLEKEIMRCSFAVETPELKSGADISSLTVKTLMQDSYLKALDDAKEYQDFLDTIVRIFIEGYGTEAGLLPEFKALNIRIALQPWTFMAESEVVNTIVQLVSIGVLSKKSATEYVYETLGLGSLDEAKRLLQQEHDELVGESQAEAITLSDRGNPVNTARQTIAQVTE